MLCSSVAVMSVREGLLGSCDPEAASERWHSQRWASPVEDPCIRVSSEEG